MSIPSDDYDGVSTSADGKVHNFETFVMPTVVRYIHSLAREKMKIHQNEVVNVVNVAVSMPKILQYIYSAIYTKAKTITSLGTTREAHTHSPSLLH